MSTLYVCILAITGLLVTVCTLKAQETSDIDSSCGTPCISDSNCTGNAICLCQTDSCDNRTCACGQKYFQSQSDPDACLSRKSYLEPCVSTEECATLFARCRGNNAGTKSCQCPDGHVHDVDIDMCTNALSCPADSSYIYSSETRVCHKVLKDCQHCTDVQSTCASDSTGDATHADALKLDPEGVFENFVNTLWFYGFYTSAMDSMSDAVTILLSVSQSRDAAGKITWFWSNGEAIAYTQSQELTLDNSSCLYLLYDGQDSKIMANESCDLATANIGCMIELPPVFCKPGNDSYGNFWNLTEGGTTARQPCPESQIGTVTRECTKSGQFKQAYYNCSLAVVQEISEQLSNGSINATEALDLLTTEVTNKTESLYITDLIKVQDTLDTVLELSKNETVDSATADNFLEVVDFMIRPANTRAWESQIEQEEKGAEELLTTVDEYVQQVSRSVATTNQTINIDKPNLELQVKPLTVDSDSGPDHLYFPQTPQAGNTSRNNRVNTSSFFLDKTAFTGAGKMVTSASSLLYKNLTSRVSDRLIGTDGAQEKESQINSQVLSLTLNPKSPPVLNPSLVLTFILFQEKDEGDVPRCSFWGPDLLNGKGAWSTEGCQLISSNRTTVKCACNHLTNFALLMSPHRASEKHEKILRVISLVGCCISMLCLSITIAVYGYYWRFLKSENAILTFALCITLLVAYVVFIVGAEQTAHKGGCTAMAVILHYLYLSVFFVMLAEGLHMMTKVIMVYDRKSYVKQLLVGAFVAPAVIVGISMGASQLEGYGNEKFCWLPPGRGVFWAFAVPVLAIILANVIIVGTILRKLFSTSAMKSKTFDDKLKLTTWTLCVLVPVMGVTWLFGIFSVSEDQVAWQYVFVLLNTLQGFGIFIFHCFLNKQLRAAMEAQKDRKRTLEDFNSELKKRSGGSKSVEANSSSKAEPSTIATTTTTAAADNMYSEIETSTMDDRL